VPLLPTSICGCLIASVDETEARKDYHCDYARNDNSFVRRTGPAIRLRCGYSFLSFSRYSMRSLAIFRSLVGSLPISLPSRSMMSVDG
jgi:hypothetical protein